MAAAEAVVPSVLRLGSLRVELRRGPGHCLQAPPSAAALLGDKALPVDTARHLLLAGRVRRLLLVGRVRRRGVEGRARHLQEPQGGRAHVCVSSVLQTAVHAGEEDRELPAARTGWQVRRSTAGCWVGRC